MNAESTSEEFTDEYPKPGWYLWKQVIHQPHECVDIGICEIVEVTHLQSWVINGKRYAPCHLKGNVPLLCGHSKIHWKKADIKTLFGNTDVAYICNL